jgi:glycosyltransferase involved in cell wall biosynthesis
VSRDGGRLGPTPDPGPGDVALPDGLADGDGSDPRVSVVVPTYGDDEYLPGALESVGAQDAGVGVEVVVVDSGGVDWLRALADRHDAVRYVYQEPSGLAAARNRGVDAATGDVVGFLDADDRWAPAKLRHQLAALEGGADVVYSDVYLVEGPDGAERVRRQAALPVRDPDRHWLDFLREGGVPMPTVVVRASCLEDERFEASLAAVEDRNLWARLFYRFRPAHVARPLAYYRVREGSMSSDVETMREAERRNLALLAEAIPDLAAHREDLERRARYAHAKRLLRAGRAGEARRVLAGLVRDGRRDPRTLALLGVALAPAGHPRLLGGLERASERLG